MGPLYCGTKRNRIPRDKSLAIRRALPLIAPKLRRYFSPSKIWWMCSRWLPSPGNPKPCASTSSSQSGDLSLCHLSDRSDSRVPVYPWVRLRWDWPINLQFATKTRTTFEQAHGLDKVRISVQTQVTDHSSDNFEELEETKGFEKTCRPFSLSRISQKCVGFLNELAHKAEPCSTKQYLSILIGDFKHWIRLREVVCTSGLCISICPCSRRLI